MRAARSVPVPPGGGFVGTNAVYTLAKGGIPLIGLATSTVTAGGAITVGTALSIVHPSAYCFLPANANATVSAAGWYYCTFSTTTAGVMFQNTYTSGVPTIPASPTPCTTASNFAGDTGEEFANTITIPANAMGLTGILRYMLFDLQTNNANAKTMRLRFSGNSGTQFLSFSLASTAALGTMGTISNAGATNSQIGASFGGSISGVVGAIDTTAATTLVFSIQRGVATDNIVILPPTVEVMA